MRLAIAVVAMVISGVSAASAKVLHGPLVTPGELAALGATVIDLRGVDAFRAGHVPGALSAPFGAFGWRAPRDGLPAMLPTPRTLAARLSRLGLTRHTPLVLVAHAPDVAALVYWTLRTIGHEHVHLLNGGIAAWSAARAVEKGEARTPRSARYIPAPELSLVADEDFVINLYDNGLLAVDCRPETHWGGEIGGPLQDDPGTIEESWHLHSAWLLDAATGWFASLEKISSELKDAHVTDKRVAFFGYDGRHAALCLFAAHELAGSLSARIYDGGIIDWEKSGNDIWNMQDGMGIR